MSFSSIHIISYIWLSQQPSVTFRKILYQVFFRVRSALSEILIIITFIAANFGLLALYSYAFSVQKLQHYFAHIGAMVFDKDLNFA